jgi:hypothetical protein
VFFRISDGNRHDTLHKGSPRLTCREQALETGLEGKCGERAGRLSRHTLDIQRECYERLGPIVGHPSQLRGAYECLAVNSRNSLYDRAGAGVLTRLFLTRSRSRISNEAFRVATQQFRGQPTAQTSLPTGLDGAGWRGFSDTRMTSLCRSLNYLPRQLSRCRTRMCRPTSRARSCRGQHTPSQLAAQTSGRKDQGVSPYCVCRMI